MSIKLQNNLTSPNAHLFELIKFLPVIFFPFPKFYLSGLNVKSLIYKTLPLCILYLLFYVFSLPYKNLFFIYELIE